MRGRIEGLLRRLRRRPKSPLRPCCQESENLVRSHYGPDKTMDMCKVCGARHFRVRVEPGTMGVKLTPPKR